MTGLEADLATLRGMSQNGWQPGSGANPMSAALDRVEAELARLRQENDSLYMNEQATNHARVNDNAYLIERAEAAERELARLRTVDPEARAVLAEDGAT